MTEVFKIQIQRCARVIFVESESQALRAIVI